MKTNKPYGRSARREVRVNFVDAIHDRLVKRAAAMGRPITYIVHIAVEAHLNMLDDRDHVTLSRKRQTRRERLVPSVDVLGSRPKPLSIPLAGDAPLDEDD